MRRSWWTIERNQIAAASLFSIALVAVFVVLIATRGEDAHPAAVSTSPLSRTDDRLPALVAPRATSALLIGDSWGVGYSAKPDTDGFVYQVARHYGWSLDMQAVSGTGYTDAGDATPPAGTYIQRLYQMPVDPNRRLVILQGSLNDVSGRFRVAQPAMKTLQDVRYRFPNAQVIVIGPGTDTMPVPPETSAVTGDLRWAAGENKAYFVPLSGLFKRDNFTELIDPATHHPNNAGHDFLAQQVIQAIDAFEREGQAFD